MMPNITRGTRIGGLMGYLVGPGRSNEHKEVHLVAGDSAIMAMHGYDELSPAAAQSIARAIDLPRQAFGVEVTRNSRSADPVSGEVTTSKVAADVWHCSLSLRSEEGQLTDEKWGEIAQSFVDRMGFTSEGSGKAACRWVAVRHGLSKNGNDHVHIAVSLVREDGTKASTHNDFKRAQELCRELEIEHGLESLQSRELGLGERGLKRSDLERAGARAAAGGAYSVDVHRVERAVRAAAVASIDEAEFVRRCKLNGLIIRPRFAAGRDDVVAGYSVAMHPKGGTPIWYGGGRLARDLTLPRLREGWPDSVTSAQNAVDEWKATSRNPWRYEPVSPGRETTEPNPEMWKQYAAEMGALRDQMKGVPTTDRATWAHVAKETAGVFAAWSQRTEEVPGDLAAASRVLARSAHLQAHQSKPKPVRMGSAANAAMILMQLASGGEGTMAEAMMLRQLGRLTVAVMDMHAALGDARRAEELASVMRNQVEAVKGRLPALEGAQTAAPTRASEAVRLATEGLAPAGSGSPVPTRIEPTAPTKTPAPRDRDGMGRT